VQDAAQERAGAGDRAARVRVAAPGQVAGVGEPFGAGHADAGADRGRQPGEERVARLVCGERGGEDRGECRQRAVDQAGYRRLCSLEQERSLVALSGLVLAWPVGGNAVSMTPMLNRARAESRSAAGITLRHQRTLRHRARSRPI
jgi:hypothetical protein